MRLLLSLVMLLGTVWGAFRLDPGSVGGRASRRRGSLGVATAGLGLALPPTMEPPVLPGLHADEFFHRLGELLRDPAKRVLLIGPRRGADQPVDAHLEPKRIAHPP